MNPDSATTLKKERAETYLSQATSALRYRNMGGKDSRPERWREYIKILGHNFYSGGTVAADQPTVNLVAARVRAQPPKLAFGVPSFDLTPYGKPVAANTVPALEAMLSLIWRQEAFDEVTRRITLDWPTFGIGIGFVGYERGGEHDIIDAKRKLFGILPDSVTEKVSKATGGKSDLFAVTEERRLRMMLKERVFLERVSPLNFLIDPCSEHWSDAQFMARRISLPFERAKLMFGKDTPTKRSLSNFALYQTSGGDDVNDKPDPEIDDKLDDSVKRIVVWEMWSITSRSVVYLNEDLTEVIGNKEFKWRSPHPAFPFVPLLWDEIPDLIYPEGLAAAIKPLNDELHMRRQRQLTEMRKGNRKWRIRPGLGEARKALESDVDNAIIEAEEGDIEQLEQKVIGGEAEQIEKLIRQDINEVTHTSPFDAAAFPQTKQTATASSYAQSASDSVLAWRKTAVELFAAEVAERTLAYIFTVFDEPVPVQITNADVTWTVIDEVSKQPRTVAIGETIEYPLVGTEHAGAFWVKTIEDTMMSMAKDVERMQLAQAFQLFSEAPWFKAREAAAHFMSTLPSVHDGYRFIRNDQEMQEFMAAQAQQQAPPGASGPMPGASPESDPFQKQEGSGNMTADMLAAAMGAQAPMTGDNGMGGADPAGGMY